MKSELSTSGFQGVGVHQGFINGVGVYRGCVEGGWV